MKRSVSFLSVLLLSIVAAAVLSGAAGGRTSAQRVDVSIRHASEAVERGVLPFEQVPQTSLRAARRAGAAAAVSAAADPPLGTVRVMPVLDDAFNTYRLREFTLRGLGQHIEVWVQSQEGPDAQGVSGIDFPAGDCRNDGLRNVVDDAQVAGLIGEFDNNIYPKESATFSVPPTRDGANAQLPIDYSGDGDKIVTLVSNVRDTNFYDTNNANSLTYIAGFFSSQVNNFLDRNVMTIDAWDWLHRTGANPPNDPSGDPCTSAPSRPRLYEGVFAHEYQHLLESYEDPDEFNWINEGVSDWAQTLTGYVTVGKSINEVGFDSHIQCFLGWLSVLTPVNPNPRAECGPENSLTRWGDQGDAEILADYGAAYSMMEMLQGRYGNSFMTALHRGDDNGFVGLQAVLDALPRNSHGHSRGHGKHGKVLAADVLHDWSLMVALDGLIDHGYRLNWPSNKKNVTTKTLDATVNWDNPHAYDSPGAPSNGSDYVRLRNGSGGYLAANDIDSLAFKGSSTLPTRSVQWTVDPTPPTGSPANGAALFSGADDERDEAIVRPLTVPAGTPQLTFDAFWNEEDSYDFGFVQISTDGGSTYTSLACTDTTAAAASDALPTAVENVPGFTGFSGTFESETCSLADYAGQNVLLAFRAFNDPAFLGTDPGTAPGFWIDNVKLGTTLISDGSSLTGWKSFTETKPNTVAGYTVRIVSIDSRRHEITVRSLSLRSDFSMRSRFLLQKRYIDRRADFVAAVVSYDDPSERSTQYAPYVLTVNGVVQPGGG